MPCSALYASCRARRRVVSAIALRMDAVSTSAYMITRPFTWRAARPDVWISEPAERRNPSLSASRMATRDTSGRSSPSRSRLMPTRTSNTPRPQVAQDLDPLERLDVRVQVADADAELVVGTRSDPRPSASVSVVTSTRSRRATRARISPSRSSTCPRTGPHLDRRIRQPGRRMICSTTTPPDAQLVGPRRGRHEDHLRGALLPLLEAQRAGCRGPTAGGTRSRRDRLPRAVAVIHPADLAARSGGSRPR